MLVQPNETLVTGTVREVRPSKDGFGGDVELEVISNDTRTPESDFLRPTPGRILTVFSSNPAQLHVGEIVRAVLELAGGPWSERTVLRKAESADASD